MRIVTRIWRGEGSWESERVRMARMAKLVPPAKSTRGRRGLKSLVSDHFLAIGLRAEVVIASVLKRAFTWRERGRAKEKACLPVSRSNWQPYAMLKNNSWYATVMMPVRPR